MQYSRLSVPPLPLKEKKKKKKFISPLVLNNFPDKIDPFLPFPSHDYSRISNVRIKKFLAISTTNSRTRNELRNENRIELSDHWLDEKASFEEEILDL